MLLELSLRPVIALLLPLALLTGCGDRQSPPPGQANATEAAPNAAADNEDEIVEEVIGTVDRSHKGEAAPDTPIENPAGAQITLADFKGKPLLLNLWATWCAPCVKEMPTLDALAVSLGDKVQVVVVSQDLKGAEVVDPFFQKAGFKKLQPYLEPAVKLSTGMGVNLPTTVLYDSQGREVWRMLGSMDWTGETAREMIAEAS